MIVCVCHRVSDREIARAVRQGCASFEELQDELRVAQGCGACNDCAQEIFDEHHAQHPCAMRMGEHWSGEGSVHVVAMETSVAACVGASAAQADTLRAQPKTA